MEEFYRSLMALQELDEQIAGLEEKLRSYDPLVAEVEAPVVALGREIEEGRKRLEELREASQRLSRAADDKRERLRRTEERLQRVRNGREEAAIRTELHLIRTAVEADEAEAIQVMEEITRTELKLDELEKKLGQAREEMEPKRAELLAERLGERADRWEILGAAREAIPSVRRAVRGTTGRPEDTRSGDAGGQ